ncbi:type I toxin-antitoxin system hok family toxin [Escherichia coli]|nr:type I toxin-antitoxin system hok family toxin [Escherichia coli]EFI4235376.1 type I toxin-antitoxin system hok family toxin [Escherichia coli]EFJ0062080.1 type I toxin-antitoxin system hok family toxin [Escherichia coli]TJR39705.1 type I toxin-antitoxin system hok family toxin [Escherichia coli]
MVVPSLHGGNINMLTKYALVAVMVLCLKVIFIRFIRSNSDCKRIKKILIELSNLLPE